MIHQKKNMLNDRIAVYKIFTLALIFSPFFRQYASFIPGVNIADLLLGFACILIVLFIRKFEIKWGKIKPIVLLWFFGTFLSLLTFIIQQEISFEVITRFIRFSYYTFLIIICSFCLEKETLIKIYKVLCTIVSIYIILQMLIYHLMGTVLPIKILPMSWMDGRTYDATEALQWATRWYFRPSGVFLEPGYAAQFLLPGLAFAIYGWNTQKNIDIKSAILIFTAITLSTSSQGIFIAFFILGLFALSLIKKRNNYLYVLRGTLTIILFVFFSIYFLNLDIVQTSIDKITGDVLAGSTTAFRIYRGFDVFMQLPLLFKIIGVGHGNIGNYVTENSLVTKFDPVVMSTVAADYTNGVSTALLYYGIIGFFLLIFIYWRLYKNTEGPYRLIVIILVLLSLVSNIFFNLPMVFYLALIYAGYNTKIKKIRGGING